MINLIIKARSYGELRQYVGKGDTELGGRVTLVNKGTPKSPFFDDTFRITVPVGTEAKVLSKLKSKGFVPENQKKVVEQERPVYGYKRGKLAVLST
ncbi:MAG: hypothetical protein EB059_09560 [Alphaproteobacteria bacterium]|nr:hypothetical protein [Alphaproteobacteria bacterium]